MTTFTAQLTRALAQGLPVESDTPQTMWREAAQHSGCDATDIDDSNDTLSLLLDETTATCDGWRTGSQYRLDTLHAYIRTLRLPAGARDNDSIAIKAEDHHGMDGIQRGGNLALHDGTMGRVVDAYITGDYDAAAQALVDGIRDGWYHRQYSGTLEAERAAGEAQ